MGTVVDIDGNVYDTVVIGTQEWTVQNLKVTKLNDGTAIPEVTGNAAWVALTTPGRCWYNNDEITYGGYGQLYNWFSVGTGKLAPAGWRVPTNDDWETLIAYLGGSLVAGGKLKEVGTSHWAAPNTGATDEVGFLGLPGDSRYYTTGEFRPVDFSYLVFWWSSTNLGGTYARDYAVFHNWADIAHYTPLAKAGVYVRCCRDAATVDFSGTPTTGNASLTVTFTDLSSSATSWLWDFGDGNTSTDQNPTHIYTKAGVFTVSLTINGTDTETKTDYINVEMVADFEAAPTNAYMQESVEFTDLTEGEPTNWEWDFGDGTPYSNQQNPRHTYTEVGAYTVRLRAWNSEKEDIEEKVEYIEVNYEETNQKVNYIIVLSSMITYDIAVPENIPMSRVMYSRGSGNAIPQVDGGVRFSINGATESPEESGFRRLVGPSITFG